jgi:hypothetical protein
MGTLMVPAGRAAVASGVEMTQGLHFAILKVVVRLSLRPELELHQE